MVQDGSVTPAGILVVRESGGKGHHLRPGNGLVEPQVSRRRDWLQDILKVLLLPLVTAFLYAIAAVYQNGHADYFGVPRDFVTVDLRRSAIPIVYGVFITLAAAFLGAVAYRGRTSWIHAVVFSWVLYGILTATLSARVGAMGITFAAAMYLGERYIRLQKWLVLACLTLWVVAAWPWLPMVFRVEVPLVLAAFFVMELIRQRLRLAVLDGRIRGKWVSYLLRLDGVKDRTPDGWDRPLQIQVGAIVIAAFFIVSMVGSYRLGQSLARSEDTFLVLHQDRKSAAVVVERYGDRVVTGAVDLSTKTIGPPWKLQVISDSRSLEGASLRIGRLTRR
jgi:hypothetical protein